MINIEDKKEQAAAKKRSGKYNCAQAVICSYCHECGINEAFAKNLGNAFAIGMGNTYGTCGALIGAGIVLGLISKNKLVSTQKMRKITDEFQARNGATQCRMLKGIDTGKVLRDCPDCVADAVEFLEKAINE